MKKNINITLDQVLLDWIDNEIKKYTFRSRSHALQIMAREYVMNKKANENLPVHKEQGLFEVDDNDSQR